MDSLVLTTRRNDETAGNRLRVYLQTPEEPEVKVQLAKVCESTGFIGRVSIGVHHNTIHDVNDVSE